MGYTYATLLVLGYIGHVGSDDCDQDDYVHMLDLLLCAGVPVNSQDIIGRTALHHAANWTGIYDLTEVLLKHKADVNLQDRFGASPLLAAIQQHTIDVIPVLLSAGAGLDVTDGEGTSPRSMYPTRPTEVSSAVRDWLVKHEGKGSVLQGDRCNKCGTRSASVNRCARCRSRLYCSPECQSEFTRANTTLSHTTHDTPPNRRGGLERTQKKLPTVRKGGESPRRDAVIRIWRPQSRLYPSHDSTFPQGCEGACSHKSKVRDERP